MDELIEPMEGERTCEDLESAGAQEVVGAAAETAPEEPLVGADGLPDPAAGGDDPAAALDPAPALSEEGAPSPEETESGAPEEEPGDRQRCVALCRTQDEPLPVLLEALLFVSADPVPAAKLAEATGRKEGEVRAVLAELTAGYRETGRAFELVEIARGYQILTRPEFSELIQSFQNTRAKDRLSASALECLAIIAYKQPIIRADIEAIRGVGCGPVLRGLLERHLIRVAGRDKRAGNPILYRTTSRFLEHFGLKSLDDLPSIEELRPPASRGPAATGAPEEPAAGAEHASEA